MHAPEPGRQTDRQIQTASTVWLTEPGRQTNRQTDGQTRTDRQYASINDFPKGRDRRDYTWELDNFYVRFHTSFVSTIPWVGFSFRFIFRTSHSCFPVVCQIPEDRDVFAVYSPGYPRHTSLRENIERCIILMHDNHSDWRTDPATFS